MEKGEENTSTLLLANPAFIEPKTSNKPSTLLEQLPLLNFNVGVIIPAYNEEKNLGGVLCELKASGYKNILVIDGLSVDGTLQVAAKNGARIVLQRGRGKGQAIRQALENDYLNAEVLVLMDADGSMSPNEVPRFTEALRNGADVVKGSRFMPGGGSFDMTATRNIGNALMTKVVNFLYSTKYTDICYGFVALNKEAIQKLSPLLKSDNFEIEAEIIVKAKKLGLNVVEVPSIEYARKSGKSNLHSFRDGFKIFSVIFSSLFK
jgi:glycosyltransferase involved in cell wall biosynthesis